MRYKHIFAEDTQLKGIPPSFKILTNHGHGHESLVPPPPRSYQRFPPAVRAIFPGEHKQWNPLDSEAQTHVASGDNKRKGSAMPTASLLHKLSESQRDGAKQPKQIRHSGKTTS